MNFCLDNYQTNDITAKLLICSKKLLLINEERRSHYLLK
jgi:hypothetical protein